MALADLYLRLSLDVDNSTSIERQEAECRRWCAAQGLPVRTVHVDRGISGFNAKVHRGGFDTALAAVTSGAVSTLVVWKLDRLSRRGIGQVGKLLDDFERVGGRLISVMDQLDTSQPQARMVIALLSEFARTESATIGMRVHSAAEAKRATGRWLNSKPLYGYRFSPDGRLVPAEPTASVMRDVFEQLAAGVTMVAICQQLNRDGVPNPAGNAWAVVNLSYMVRNPAYAGLVPVQHRGNAYPDVYRHPDTGEEVSCLAHGAQPIVTRALQLAALEQVRVRADRRGVALPERGIFTLLSGGGLGRCANCDQPLKTWGSYRCPSKDAAGNIVCAAPALAGTAVVDRAVAAVWQELVCHGGLADNPLRRAVAELWEPPLVQSRQSGRLRADLDALRARLVDADAARYVRGDLDERRHSQIAQQLTRRIAQLERQVATRQQPPSITRLFDPDYVAQRWEESSRELRRELVRLAWGKILLARAGLRGKRFEPARLTYIRNSAVGDTLTERLRPASRTS